MNNNNLKKLFEDLLRENDFYKDIDKMNDDEKKEIISIKNKIFSDIADILEVMQEISEK